MVDQFSNRVSGVSGPITYAFTVTPDDGNDLAYVTRGVYVGGSGDLHVTLGSGDEATFVGLAAGVVHPIRVSRVHATGTSATDIIGVY